jgi:hypothetical protein
MGTLIFWGVIVLGVFLGIILFSLLSMAQKAEEVYDRMPRGDGIGIREDTYFVPASEPLSPASRGEVRPQGELSESVAAS